MCFFFIRSSHTLLHITKCVSVFDWREVIVCVSVCAHMCQLCVETLQTSTVLFIIKLTLDTHFYHHWSIDPSIHPGAPPCLVAPLSMLHPSPVLPLRPWQHSEIPGTSFPLPSPPLPLLWLLIQPSVVEKGFMLSILGSTRALITTWIPNYCINSQSLLW